MMMIADNDYSGLERCRAMRLLTLQKIIAYINNAVLRIIYSARQLDG